ncbi:MAG: tetratricopeptide repeat protein [Thermodesulfobacteriota bacterium]
MRVKAFLAVFAVAPVFLLSSCVMESRVIKQDARPLSAGEELRLAMAYESKDMLEPALKSYSRVSELEPSEARAHFGMGNVYLKMRRYNEAEERYKKAIELDPLKGAFYNNLAWLYIETANLVTAMNMANIGMALDMERRYIYLDTLGVAETLLGNYAGAVRYLKEAAIAVPFSDARGQLHIYTHLLEVYEKQNKKKEAAAVEEKLKSLRSGVPVTPLP